MKNKITVIIPVYNVEKYIGKCLDSLLKQTISTFDILVVNDGSVDNSINIINDYYKEYPNRFDIVNKVNGGYGSVLEYSIKVIKTDYFLVCDPDDYLHKDAIKNLLDNLNDDIDILIGTKAFVYENSDDIDLDLSYNDNYVTLLDNKVYDNSDESFNDLYFVDPSPHSKVYKKSLLKNIPFIKKVPYTDNILFYIALIRSKSVKYINIICSYYLIDRDGNTMTNIKPDIIKYHCEVFLHILLVSDRFKNNNSMLYYRMFLAYKYIFNKLYDIKGSKKDIINQSKYLYELLDKLNKFDISIKKKYQKYYKGSLKEQRNDFLLLSKFSYLVFKYNIIKVIKEQGL